MIFSKKYKFCFFACLFLFACKSADCGCPMAEQTTIQEQATKNKKEFQVVLSDDEKTNPSSYFFMVTKP